jgi:hypothetical protein
VLARKQLRTALDSNLFDRNSEDRDDVVRSHNAWNRRVAALAAVVSKWG